MGVNFALTPVGEKKYARMCDIDNAMCAALNVVADDNLYYRHWYDRIGLMLACGKNFTELKELYPDPLDVAIIEFLETNYTVTNWGD